MQSFFCFILLGRRTPSSWTLTFASLKKRPTLSLCWTAILNNSVLNVSLPFFLFLFQSRLSKSTPSLVILSQPPSHSRWGSPYVRRIWEELGVEAHLVEKHGCLREENRPCWKDPCLLVCVWTWQLNHCR